MLFFAKDFLTNKRQHWSIVVKSEDARPNVWVQIQALQLLMYAISGNFFTSLSPNSFIYKMEKTLVFYKVEKTLVSISSE